MSNCGKWVGCLSVLSVLLLSTVASATVIVYEISPFTIPRDGGGTVSLTEGEIIAEVNLAEQKLVSITSAWAKLVSSQEPETVITVDSASINIDGFSEDFYISASADRLWMDYSPGASNGEVDLTISDVGSTEVCWAMARRLDGAQLTKARDIYLLTGNGTESLDSGQPLEIGTSNAPEPATLMILAAGVPLLLKRRRNRC